MTSRRGGLGRGLESLIPTGDAGTAVPFAMLPVDQIHPNESQPRRRFDHESL